MDDSKRIVKNRVKCNKCNQVIESHSETQYTVCSCGQTKIKGAFKELIRESVVGFDELTQYYLMG